MSWVNSVLRQFLPNGLSSLLLARALIDEEKNSRAVRKKRTNQSSTAVIFSWFSLREPSCRSDEDLTFVDRQEKESLLEDEARRPN